MTASFNKIFIQNPIDLLLSHFPKILDDVAHSIHGIPKFHNILLIPFKKRWFSEHFLSPSFIQVVVIQRSIGATATLYDPQADNIVQFIFS